MIRQAKLKHELGIAFNIKTDTKSFFSYVKNKTTVKRGIGPLKSIGGEIVSENGSMARILNTFFASVFNKEITIISEVCSSVGSSNVDVQLEIVEFNSLKVLEVVRKLQDNKTPGLDEINSTFIKKEY